MYHQVRASSSCSAPPDLLLVSDRENNIPLRSPVVNIIGATTAPATTTTSPSSSALNGCHITSATNNNQRHNQKLQHHHVTATQQQQHQLSLAYNGTKDITNTKQQQQHHHQKQSSAIANSLSHSKHGQQLPQQQDCQQQQPSFQDIEGQLEATANNHSSTRHAHQTQQSHNHHHQSHQQQRSEDHIRLEVSFRDIFKEFRERTCNSKQGIERDRHFITFFKIKTLQFLQDCFLYISASYCSLFLPFFSFWIRSKAF